MKTLSIFALIPLLSARSLGARIPLAVIFGIIALGLVVINVIYFMRNRGKQGREMAPVSTENTETEGDFDSSDLAEIEPLSEATAVAGSVEAVDEISNEISDVEESLTDTVITDVFYDEYVAGPAAGEESAEQAEAEEKPKNSLIVEEVFLEAENNAEEIAETKKTAKKKKAEEATDDDNLKDDRSEDDEDAAVIRGIDEDTGLAIVVRYKKSFRAKIIQTTDEVKEYYSAIKNELLSYKGVKSRVSWNYDSFTFGKNNIAKLVMRGKKLTLCLALDASDYSEQYKVEETASKKYEGVACLFKIQNARRFRLSYELIAAMADKFGLEKGRAQTVDYCEPFETTEELIKKGYIRELVSKENYEKFINKKKK